MTIPFVQAKYYSAISVKRRIDFVVLHDMEMAEQPTTAEACAEYFRHPSTPSSCHFCVDSDSEVQCVRENDIAYHAPPNTHSIGIEHAGYARQTRAQWLDPYGLPMLRRSAKICRELCDKHDVPKTFLSVADLKAGKRGVTTHRNISLAFGQSTHTDPGPYFPVDHYMALVQLDITVPEDDMQLNEDVSIGSAFASEFGLPADKTYTVAEMLAGGWGHARQAARDAAVARALAEAAAQSAGPLTAAETEAVVEKAIAENVVRVDVRVNVPQP